MARKKRKEKEKVDEIGMSAEWRWWIVGVGFFFFLLRNMYFLGWLMG